MSDSSLKPIQTHYDGCWFRSRLEARWAVFFNTLGIIYEYEREGYDLSPFGCYLPDFWLPGLKHWVEIKGVAPGADERCKAKALAIATGFPVVIVSGVPRLVEWADGFGMNWFCDGACYVVLESSDPVADLAMWKRSPKSFDPEWVDFMIRYNYRYSFDCYSGVDDMVRVVGILLPSRFDRTAITNAVAIMKSARFEHGETP